MRLELTHQLLRHEDPRRLVVRRRAAGLGAKHAPSGVMTTLRSFVQRHPLLSYFTLAFAISWGGIFIVAGPDEILGTTAQRRDALMPYVVLAILGGPSIAGVALTALIHGRAGLRALVDRVLTWRVGARFFAIALLFAPVMMLTILYALSIFNDQYLPRVFVADDAVTVLLFGVPVALGAGFFEELGWTGFATPKMRQRYGGVATGVLLGVAWAVWHLLPAYWFWTSGAPRGSLSLASYMLDPFLFLVGYRVLMVAVYERTTSVLVAIVMHFSLTLCARIFMPEMVGAPLLLFDVVWAAAMWIVVAAAVVRLGAPRPLRMGLNARS
jgi:uncharacterized protein